MGTNSLIDNFAKKFLGTGIVDKHFPQLLTFFKQITYLTSFGETITTIPHVGKFIVSNKDSSVGLYLRLHKSYEPVQTAFFSQIVKSGDVVLDIGANIGFYSVLAAKQVGEKGKVLAFEPDPKSVSLLERNLALNTVEKNVQIIPVALSNHEKEGNFIQNKYSPGDSYLSDEKKGDVIQLNTLDNIVQSLQLSAIDVIKIDIEGAEIAFLEGATDTFIKHKGIHLFIECNPKALKRHGDSVKKLLDELAGNGFSIKSIVNEYTGKVEKFTEQHLVDTLQRYPYTTLYAQN